MNRIGLKQLIESYTTAPVYPDFIPESQIPDGLPAVAYDHTNNGTDRDRQGNRAGFWDTWRLTIIGKNRGETDTVLSELDIMDNKFDSNFQRVHILSTTDDPVNESDEFFRISVDIKTYDR